MLTLLINETKPLAGLFASSTGGIGSVPDISVADEGQAVSVQTFTRTAGVITDSFVAGDVIHIGIGDGVNAPVCYIELSSASPATGTMAINTVGMVALFAATSANQLTLNVGVVRTRGVSTNTIFSAPIVIHRSVIDPDTAVPTPSVLGTGVASSLLIAINAALGFVRLDASARLPAVDGSQLTNVPNTLPSQTGNSGKYLTTNGTATSWGTVSTGLTVGTTAIASGTSGRILYDNAGVLGEYAITGTGSVMLNTRPSLSANVPGARPNELTIGSAPVPTRIFSAEPTAETNYTALIFSQNARRNDTDSGWIRDVADLPMMRTAFEYNYETEGRRQHEFNMDVAPNGAAGAAAFPLRMFQGTYITSGTGVGTGAFDFNVILRAGAGFEAGGGVLFTSTSTFNEAATFAGGIHATKIQLGATAGAAIGIDIVPLNSVTQPTAGRSWMRVGGGSSESLIVNAGLTGGYVSLCNDLGSGLIVADGTGGHVTYLTAPATGTLRITTNGSTLGTVDAATFTGNSATVTTNANLTGHVTSVGNAAVLGSFTMAQLSAAVSDGDPAYVGAANTFTAGQTISSTTSLLLGTAGSAVGNVGFRNATSGTTTLAPATGALGTGTVTLPLSGTLATLEGANTFTGANVNSTAGAASLPAMRFSGVPFAGTGTTSFPLVYINDANATASTTLNTAGTYFGVNGDGTQDLMNLMTDGVSKCKVTSTGSVQASEIKFGTKVLGSGGTGELYGGDGTSVFRFGGTASATIWGAIALGSTTAIYGANASRITGIVLKDTAVTEWNSDTTLSRSSAGVLQLGTGTTANALGSLLLTNLTTSGTLSVTGASTLTGLLTTNGGITLGDAQNIAFNTTTGTKIGATTSQKLSFWNATPIVQPTTAVASATVASPGAGTNIKTDDTFDGYTLAQVVKALRNAGLLA